MHNTNIVLNKKQVFLAMIHFIKVLDWCNKHIMCNKLTAAVMETDYNQEILPTERLLGSLKVIIVSNINSRNVLSKDFIRFWILNLSQIEILVKSLSKLYKFQNRK